MNQPFVPPVFRAPVPPVSPPAWETPHGSGNVGEKYGTQSRGSWATNDDQEKPIVDALRSVSLWRVSVLGPVLLRISYGTSSFREFVDIETPMVGSFPGQVTIYARPAEVDRDEPVECTVTLTPATAALSQIRKIHVAGGIANPFDDGAIRFTALTASTLNISGNVVAVPALSSVPLVSGATLTLGTGYQEFEP